MLRDRLLLLKPDFMDQDQGPCYCPACATIEGLLAFYPQLREALDISYLDFPRPRAAVIVTDGYIEAIDRKLVGALHGIRVHAIVTRDGSTNLLARAGIPYTQLGRLPT